MVTVDPPPNPHQKGGDTNTGMKRPKPFIRKPIDPEPLLPPVHDDFEVIIDNGIVVEPPIQNFRDIINDLNISARQRVQ